jgi:hypothetical protein
MFTRFFLLPSAIWAGEPKDENLFAPILNGFEKDQMKRSRNAQPYFTKREIAFPPGASAVYYERASTLGVTNTAENIARLARLLGPEKATRLTGIHSEIRLVEISPTVTDQLSVRATFPALEAKLGDKLKTVFRSVVKTTPGQRAVADLTGQLPPPPDEKKDGPAPEPKNWPPKEGVEAAHFGIELGIAPREWIFDAVLDFRYAAPPKAGQPALRMSNLSNAAPESGVIFTVQTFTVVDPKSGALRHYAVLLRGERMDGAGRTVTELREILRKNPEKLLEPAPDVAPQ